MIPCLELLLGKLRRLRRDARCARRGRTGSRTGSRRGRLGGGGYRYGWLGVTLEMSREDCTHGLHRGGSRARRRLRFSDLGRTLDLQNDGGSVLEERTQVGRGAHRLPVHRQHAITRAQLP